MLSFLPEEVSELAVLETLSVVQNDRTPQRDLEEEFVELVQSVSMRAKRTILFLECLHSNTSAFSCEWHERSVEKRL